jgi:hypothetical protein
MCRRVLFIVALVATPGCNGSTDPRLDNTVIGVRGLARTTAAAPVSDATVNITVFRQTCGGPVDGSATTQTDAEGRYVTLVSGSFASGPRCVRVQASKAAMQGVADAPEVIFPIRLPTDTINVDVTLQ